MDDETFNREMKDIFYQGRPCSYHYTKSLAEHLVAQQVESGYIPSYCGRSRPDCADSTEVEDEVADDTPNNETPDVESPEKTAWRPFPAAIIRPSIITCSWKEPFPGWIDNYNGTTGFMVVSGKGVLRTIHANPDYVTDVIPVDVVINTCIASAWYVAACHPKGTSSRLAVRRASDGSSSSGLSSAGTSERGGGTDSEVFVVNCVSGKFFGFLNF